MDPTMLMALLNSGGGGGGQGGGGPQVASGLFSGVIGALQRKEAKKWLKGHPQPIEQMPREILENQGIAQNMANTGLPSEQYNNAMQNIQRQQLQALKFAGDRRGALAVLPGLVHATNSSIANLDAADAGARMANEKNLIGVNAHTAAVKRDLYNENTRQPYNRDLSYYMQLLGAGNQNLISGADKLFAGTGSLLGGSKGGGQGSGGTDTGGVYNPSYSEYYNGFGRKKY